MKRLKLQAGSNLVEFALVLPLLLVLMFGIVDFGLALFDKAVITNAAREGARTGVVFRAPPLSNAGLTAEVQAAVTRYCSTYLVSFGPATNTTTVSWVRAGAQFSSGDTLTVQVNYPYHYVVMSKLIPSLGTLNLRSISVMRFE